MFRRVFGTAGTVATILCWSGVASAELVFLTSGRTLSVNTYRLEGDRAILELRSGGQVSFPAALVARVAPDEVPYPAPEGASSIDAVATLPTSQVEPPLQYVRLVEETSLRHEVDPKLVHAVIAVESRYQPRARSQKGAMGLMQLMPATAQQYAVANPYDPAANVEAGVRHLRSLLDRFDLKLALAAYNAGEAAVTRFGGVPPYRETRDYIQRVLALVGPLTR
ncbi:MAG: transglycosylase SLT domain-containing protein [Luteitalea sp.]|nr:transglycosylase SLT domain-containing protein [Luteitalea sp.]